MFARCAFVATVCLLALGATVASASEHAEPAAKAGSTQDAGMFVAPRRRCYGGLEDGKTVVRSADLADDAAQTTLKGCRLGGGAVARAPQSPTISAGGLPVA